jgi:hypothetical protein
MSLSSKIKFEKAYIDYLDCLKKSPEKNPECIDIIKRYHYLLGEKDYNYKQHITPNTNSQNEKTVVNDSIR